MDRRDFLGGGAGAAVLALAARPGRLLAQVGLPLRLVPIRASPDRLFRITVCVRPFRAAGPRIETEEVGRKLVVHHYGHGGSGWSLSWGSAMAAAPLAMAPGHRDIAVVGAGAIGLTTALVLQRAGARVTIYARERFPDVRSARATGTWSPSSRIAWASAAGPGFAAAWERMTRASFAYHQRYLGYAGAPVEFTDRYNLADLPQGTAPAPPPIPAAPAPARPDRFFSGGYLVRDLSPRAEILPAGSHPFPVGLVKRVTDLQFNIAELAHQLETEFLLAGGRFEHADFRSPADFGRLKQKVVVNCTGYGARALFGDKAVVPVRGQIGWLIPQEGVNYGLYYRGIGVVGRRDGIVVQDYGEDDWFGYGDENEQPDRAAAEASVAQIARLFPPWHPPVG